MYERLRVVRRAADRAVGRLLCVLLLAVWLLLGSSPSASGLNTSVDVTQYKHTSWRIRDGFVGGFIQAFAQTSDGYLWLGATDGLYRFDGIKVVRWDAPVTATVSNMGSVLALVAARDGTLWIASAGGLLTLKNGTFALVETPGRRRVNRMVEDDQQSIWLALRSNPSEPSPLCRAVRSTVACTDLRAVAGAPIGALFADSKGSLWAGSANGVARVTPGPTRQFALPRQVNGSMAFAEQDGALLLGMPDGLARFTDGKTELAHPAPPTIKPVPPSAMLRDRDGGLWVATMGRGLWHVHGGRTDVFTAADGLSSDMVLALFEDREGSIWVATSDGLDRFRDVVTPTYAAARTFSNGAVSSVLASHDGSLWVGTVDGLNHWDGDRLTVYRDKPRPVPVGARQIVMPSFPARVSSLFEDSTHRLWVSDGGAGYLDGDRFVRVVDVDRTVWFIGEDAQKDIWISLLNQLVRVRRDGTTESRRFAELGASTFAMAAAADATHGGLWLGFADGSVVHFRDGRVVRRYSASDRTETMSVFHLRPSLDGAIWAATKRGLIRISDGGMATLNAAAGLPCDSVHWSMPDDAGSVWLYMPCGLVRLRQQDLDAWIERIADGQAPGARVPSTAFDSVDGVRLLSQPTHYQPQVTKARDGRIWFATLDGVAVIDPRRIRANTIAPPVHIEQLVADRTRFGPVSGTRLPPRVRDLQIDYTALSLAAPEKNRFRIKLEGRDADWQDVGTRRQAFYTDLSPGAYRFRVAGSNNSGVWNEAGAALEFAIAPAYYQTRWFQALVVVSTFAVMCLAYLARVRQVSRDYQRRLDERVNERTRIARELHDTLLQSFHGLLLRFQTAAYLLPDRPSDAKENLESAIQQAAKAITEGRDAVQGLRASTVERNDLAVAIRTLGDELATDPTCHKPSTFSVGIEGEPRDLQPIVRDEIYKIAAEALRNSFRHAGAGRVEVEMRYDGEEFRLRVRDDGKGIDQTVLAAQGVEGHYGLRGMPERAALIGGKLAVWSEVGAGTEVELRIPASTAYLRPPRRSGWSRLSASSMPARDSGEAR